MHLLLALTLTLAAQEPAAAPSPALHLGNGIKIGDVTDRSALVWVRLTGAAERNRGGTPWPEGRTRSPRGWSWPRWSTPCRGRRARCA